MTTFIRRTVVVTEPSEPACMKLYGTGHPRTQRASDKLVPLAIVLKTTHEHLRLVYIIAQAEMN